MLFRIAVLGVFLGTISVVPGTSAQVGDPGSLTNLQSGSSIQNPQEGAIVAGNLYGSVVTLDGHAASNARVEVRELTTGRSVGSGYTDPSGSFSISNLTTGTYEVVATSGTEESRQQIQVDGLDNNITLRLPHLQTGAGAGATVSVSQMRVPEKAVNELVKARDALSKDKPDEAEKRISKALKIDPQYSDALTLRAILSIKSGDLKSAMDDLNSAIQYDSNNGLAYVAMGTVYNSQSRFNDAIREVERGAALVPNFWQAYFEMGRAQLGKGDFEAALRNVKRAEELVGQEYAPMHIVKGSALLGLKNFTGAISEFEMFLAKQKNGELADAVRQQLEIAKNSVATAQARVR